MELIPFSFSFLFGKILFSVFEIVVMGVMSMMARLTALIHVGKLAKWPGKS